MAGDTVYALSSGRPPAGIAVIRISGAAAHASAAAFAGELPPARQAAVRRLRDPEGRILDSALVLRFNAPESATGEDVVEFHCHGGRAVIEAVLGALEANGALRPALPGEFTRRAFENGRIDLTEAEGLADLLEAETESQRRAALAMARGQLRREVEAWLCQVLSLSARAEAMIDYDEDEDLEGLSELKRDCLALATDLATWVNRPRVEPLKDGLRVVLAGPPNSGKSSLLNALAGADRAIVTEIPGTTRDSVDVPVAVEGVPLILTDTAGLRTSEDAVERIGVERAETLIGQADILVWLGDAEALPPHARAILVHPRCDLDARGRAPPGSLPVSSVTGSGVTELLRRIANCARDLLPAEGALAINQRQAECLAAAQMEIEAASMHDDLVVIAERLRAARSAFDRLTGRAGIEDMLDSLFGRFCLGK